MGIIIIGVLGSLASIAGLIVAYIQTQRIKKLKTVSNAENWVILREVLSIVRWSHPDNRPIKRKNDPSLEKVFSKSISIYRQILKMIVLAENNFNMETIRRWNQLGKLDEDWEINELKKLLPSTHESLEKMSELKEKFSYLLADEEFIEFAGKTMSNSGQFINGHSIVQSHKGSGDRIEGNKIDIQEIQEEELDKDTPHK